MAPINQSGAPKPFQAVPIMVTTTGLSPFFANDPQTYTALTQQLPELQTLPSHLTTVQQAIDHRPPPSSSLWTHLRQEVGAAWKGTRTLTNAIFSVPGAIFGAINGFNLGASLALDRMPEEEEIGIEHVAEVTAQAISMASAGAQLCFAASLAAITALRLGHQGWNKSSVIPYFVSLIFAGTGIFVNGLSIGDIALWSFAGVVWGDIVSRNAARSRLRQHLSALSTLETFLCDPSTMGRFLTEHPEIEERWVYRLTAEALEGIDSAPFTIPPSERS